MSATGQWFDVDSTKFDNAIALYVATTSKGTEEAINGKSRDLMFRACNRTPMMQGQTLGARGVDDIRALAVYRRRKMHGFPAFTRPMPFSTQDVFNSMAHIRSPRRGYLKSATAKAGRAFPRIGGVSNEPSPSKTKDYSGATAATIAATPRVFASQMKCLWDFHSSASQAGAQAILDRAFQEAVDFIFNDIVYYFQKYHADLAWRISQ